MSKALPDAIERRNILYGDKHSAADRIALGDSYFETGRLLDALEFYVRAEHGAGIQSIRERAIADGDAFLAARVEQLGQEGIDEAQWKTLADHAAAKGLDLYAATARARAGLDTDPDDSRT